MPDPVETTDPEGVDFAWVMQTTFVLTILFGAPIVALASIPVSLPTWGARVSFAIRVGAIIWILVACGVFFYERRTAARRASGDGTRKEPVGDGGEDGGGIPKRGGDENRTGSGRDDAEDRRGNDRGDTRGGDAATRSSPQSASSDSSSDT